MADTLLTGTTMIEKELASKNKCLAYPASNQTLSTGVSADVALGSEIYDTNEMHSNITNNELIYIKKSGYYSMFAQASFAANATGDRHIGISDGTTTLTRGSYRAVSSGPTRISCTTTRYLNEGDSVHMFCMQDSGGNLALNATETHLCVIEIL